MERQYCVYKHTNRTNGKIYIGITSQKPQERWDSGWGYQKNKHFWYAIRKYGWDGFDHEVLFSGLSQEDAFAKERELIRVYGSNNYERGYNMTEGGEAGSCLSGERHPMWGKHHSEETKAKLRAQRKGVPYSPERYSKFLETLDREALRQRAYVTIVGYNNGRPRSEEHKRKIAESNRGLKRSPETRRRISKMRKIPIIQLTVGGDFVREWDCAKTAAETLDIQAGHISKVCKNRRKTAGGFVWQYKFNGGKNHEY